MRMRKKKNLEPRMALCASVLASDPASLRGQWLSANGKSGGELHLEIGCGKGRFLSEHALRAPDSLFVGVERVPSVLLLALERAVNTGIENMRFLGTDARLLGDVFAEHEVDRIYLNFSDPWPASNRAKRRLTHRGFLAVYDRFLKPGGEIEFKTDNQKLFEFSVCELSQFGYTITALTYDLHALETDNIMTEYEEKFARQGFKIHRCVAQKPSALK